MQSSGFSRKGMCLRPTLTGYASELTGANKAATNLMALSLYIRSVFSLPSTCHANHAAGPSQEGSIEHPTQPYCPKPCVLSPVPLDPPWRLRHPG